ncbi:PIN domain-containing protein [Ponticaulis sp.]|uniref:PIN domain-containing protein n=1 Tax=Ponticaulis sp. TaxID=2020902 RepID=UPI00262D8734|nr:PIN domain-containing protein [Ponticaulis sp.]MDF1679292.1 PIN domain-containing protein [Ponticaulis sp.]
MIRAVIDACILAGTIRRHMVLLFAHEGLLEPVWSLRILHETQRAIPKTLKASGMDKETLAKHAGTVCDLILESFPEALQEPQSMTLRAPLPDPDDEHVLELALSAKASVIVTENLRDFPKKALSGTGIRAINTDHFLTELAEQSPDAAQRVMANLIQIIDNRVFDEAACLTRLKQVGLKRLAKTLAA